MKFINPTDKQVRVNIKVGKAPCILVDPGEVVEIPEYASKPRLNPNRSRRKAIIEELAPQLKPADPDELEEWLQAPLPEDTKRGKYVPSYHELIRQGTPPAMAKRMVEAAAQSLIEETKLAEEFELKRIKAQTKARNNKE